MFILLKAILDISEYQTYITYMIYFYIGNYGERINLDLFGSIQEIQHKMFSQSGIKQKTY